MTAAGGLPSRQSGTTTKNNTHSHEGTGTHTDRELHTQQSTNTSNREHNHNTNNDKNNARDDNSLDEPTLQNTDKKNDSELEFATFNLKTDEIDVNQLQSTVVIEDISVVQHTHTGKGEHVDKAEQVVPGRKVEGFGKVPRRYYGPLEIDDTTLLGKGQFKEAHVIDEDTVFLTPRETVNHNRPHSMDELREEVSVLNYLEKEHNLPVLKTYGEGLSTRASTGEVVEGIIAERKLFNGKDVLGIRRGNNAQGLTMEDVNNSITPETLEELKKMDKIIERDQVVIKDLQIMYGKDGTPVIADPMDAYAGKYADPDDVDRTRKTLKQNIEMVENILTSK